MTRFSLGRSALGLASRRRRPEAADGFPLVVSSNCNACLGAIAGSGARAIATGGCWQALAATVPGFRPVAEEDVSLHGVRDLDDAERARLERSRIAVDPRPLPEPAGPVYLHVDLDVLDPSEGRVNEFAASGGLTTAELVEAVREIAERTTLAAASVTAYNPDVDSDGRAREAALRVIDALAEAAG